MPEGDQTARMRVKSVESFRKRTGDGLAFSRRLPVESHRLLWGRELRPAALPKPIQQKSRVYHPDWERCRAHRGDCPVLTTGKELSVGLTVHKEGAGVVMKLVKLLLGMAHVPHWGAGLSTDYLASGPAPCSCIQ